MNNVTRGYTPRKSPIRGCIVALLHCSPIVRRVPLAYPHLGYCSNPLWRKALNNIVHYYIVYMGGKVPRVQQCNNATTY